MLHEHHRDVVEFDGVGQGHERAIRGRDLGRLVVVDPVADIFDAGRGEKLGRVVGLGQAGTEPADRLFAGERSMTCDRALDHRLLVLDQMNRALLIGVAHELPAGVMRRARDPLVILADAGIDREGGRISRRRNRSKKRHTPTRMPYSCQTSSVHPVRGLARRRRQHLARHRPPISQNSRLTIVQKTRRAPPGTLAAGGRRSPNSRVRSRGITSSLP